MARARARARLTRLPTPMVWAVGNVWNQAEQDREFRLPALDFLGRSRLAPAHSFAVLKQGQELLRLAFLGVAPLRKTVDVLQSGAALLVATVWSAPGRVSAGAPARADGGAVPAGLRLGGLGPRHATRAGWCGLHRMRRREGGVFEGVCATANARPASAPSKHVDSKASPEVCGHGLHLQFGILKT